MNIHEATTIHLTDRFGNPCDINFSIDPNDTSGPIALNEAGIEYNLSIDEFGADSIVLDCGAGYGEFSIECALKGAKKILSFEPNPTLVEYLTLNTFNFPEIEVHPVGVWIENVDSRLYLRETGTASASIHEIQFDPKSELGLERVVKQIRLINLGEHIDELVRSYPAFCLALKLDVEGAEHRIIEFLSATGRLRSIKKLWVEYHYNYQDIPSLLGMEYNSVTIEEKSLGLGLIKAEQK